MPVNYEMTVANAMGSEAQIDREETIRDNRELFEENNYSYVPLPLDWKYYDVENDELRDLEEIHLFPLDASIIGALKQLAESPFLLMEMSPVHNYIHEGEIKNRYEDNFDEDEAFHFYNTTTAVLEYPELFDELWDLTQKKSKFWIATIADVNKREVREALYPLIAELESRFASELKNSGFDAGDLIPDLRADTIGRWKKAQHQGVDLHIAEQMSLSELAKTIGKESSLREEFGFKSRNQFDKAVGGIIKLRNKVMHPTKPLIWDKSDLVVMVDRIQRAENIIETHGGKIIRG